MTPKVYWKNKSVRLLLGDAVLALGKLAPESFDTIIADPPYFLSGRGTTCRGGKRAPVSKGAWDAPRTPQEMHEWNLLWLGECVRVMRPNATLWVSGTMHNIHSVGYAMQTLGLRILNDIAWVKPNPPPNLGRRCFTHASETILWAARDNRSRYCFDYPEMRARNGGKQMRSDWHIAPPRPSERTHGKHPTQKPLALAERMLAASNPPNGRVLDPFCGSGTVAVAAIERGCEFVGIDASAEYLGIARARVLEAAKLRRRRASGACVTA